jgi:hypothetical protein
MQVTVEILFGRPQSEIASRLCAALSTSLATSIVTGFATEDGMHQILAPIQARPTRLDAFVVGAGTFRAYAAFDALMAAGVPGDRLFVHLGFTKPRPGQHKFVKYHPMLHSKVYYTEQPRGMATAFIGSHNTTGFALTGKNGEASVRIDGERDAEQFRAIRSHIREARAQTVPYTPGMREGYAWWTHEWLDGLRVEVRNEYTQSSGVLPRTLLVYAQQPKSGAFKPGDELYLEIPEAIRLDSTKAPVHLFLFKNLPATPQEAIARAPIDAQRIKCRCPNLSDGAMSVARCQWRIADNRRPVLLPVSNDRFATSTPPTMQQLVVPYEREGVDLYDYLFEEEKTEWYPDYVESKRVAELPPIGVSTADAAEETVAEREVVKITDGWKLVRGLRSTSPSMGSKERKALEAMRPESGSFVMVALRGLKR